MSISHDEKTPIVSIIIPCKNEEKYIRTVLDNIIAQDYPKHNVEVFVVDGMSTDESKTIIEEYSLKYPNIYYIENINETVPYALNRGIKKSRGMIMIMGAHSTYPADYIKKLVYWSYKLDADNVGGVMNTMPANNSFKARAIARAMSSSFGVGNAYFRTGTQTVKQVDTVTFGFYKREVFERIGLFDENLTRNQDDEFNARLTKNGGKIYLIPEVEISYFARSHFKQLWKMFYQYGYFKPLVNLKLGKVSTLRQLVPPLFVISFLSGLVLSSFSKILSFLTLLLLGIYLTGNLISAVISAKKSPVLIPFLSASFMIIHFSYGFGYAKGLLDFVLLKLHKKKVIKAQISR